MAGPSFPKFRGKFSGIGAQAAHAQVPGLPYQGMKRTDAFGQKVDTKVSGDFIDVRVSGAKGKFISIGLPTAAVVEDFPEANFPGIFAHPLNYRSAVFSPTARGFGAPRTQELATEHAYALRRLPNGQLGVLTGGPNFSEANAAGVWHQHSTLPSPYTIQLQTTTDGITFTPLLSHRMGNDDSPSGSDVASYTKNLARYQFVLGSVVVSKEDGVQWTCGFASNEYKDDSNYHTPTYIFRDYKGDQQQAAPWAQSANRVRFARVTPRCILAGSIRSVQGVYGVDLALSKDNGETWSAVPGTQEYTNSLYPWPGTFHLSVSNGLGAYQGVPPGDYSGERVAFQSESRQPSLEHLFILPETTTTAIVVVNAYKCGGGHIDGSISSQTVTGLGHSGSQEICYYSPPDTACSPPAMQIAEIPGFSTHRNSNATVTPRFPVYAAVFRVDLENGTASKLVDLKNFRTDTSPPERLFMTGDTFQDFVAVPVNSEMQSSTRNYPNGGWWNIDAGSASFVTTFLTGAEVSGSITNNIPPSFPAAGMVIRDPVYTSPTTSYSHSTSHTSLPVALSAPLDILFYDSVTESTAMRSFIIKIRAIFHPKEKTKYLLYNEEPQPINQVFGVANLPLRQWVTEDWITFKRLPDLPWPAKNVGRRRWLREKILLPVYLPKTAGNDRAEHALFESADDGATWDKRGTIKLDAAGPNDLIAARHLLTTYSLVEWFADEWGKEAAANPYSGAWVCDERVPGPKLED